jgi:hypothetical protein
MDSYLLKTLFAIKMIIAIASNQFKIKMSIPAKIILLILYQRKIFV